MLIHGSAALALQRTPMPGSSCDLPHLLDCYMKMVTAPTMQCDCFTHKNPFPKQAGTIWRVKALPSRLGVSVASLDSFVWYKRGGREDFSCKLLPSRAANFRGAARLSRVGPFFDRSPQKIQALAVGGRVRHEPTLPRTLVPKRTKRAVVRSLGDLFPGE